MKAVICPSYGPPDVLRIEDIPKPIPKKDEVLVKIVATAVNSGDVRVRSLNVDGIFRILMRLILGFRKPRKPILGVVLSGIVEEVGIEVTKFSPGDEVFASLGINMGAYVQYKALNENSMILSKPENASFEEAAAFLFGGLSGNYFLEKAGIKQKPGQKVLIYGATGSVGSAAVEIAAHYKAHVTSVCSTQGIELATKIGSDVIIDYTTQDITKLEERFDIIFDAVGKASRKQISHLLTPEGKYVTVGGMDVAKNSNAQMMFLKELFEAGELHANIDRTYMLDKIVEAHRYVDTGKKKANVVIRMHK